jgi:hypothetical protein
MRRCGSLSGDGPIYVAEQMGHADAGRLAANLYAKAVKRRAKLSGAYLAEYERALVWAQMDRADWAQMGTNAEALLDEAPVSESTGEAESAL